MTDARCHRCHLSYGAVAYDSDGARKFAHRPPAEILAERHHGRCAPCALKRVENEIGWERFPGSATDYGVSVGMEFN
jgi:hypothetical protein